MCKNVFLHRTCGAKLFEAIVKYHKIPCSNHEILVLFEHGFQLYKNLNSALNCLHDATWESLAALTDHLANAFFCKHVARIYDVVTM